MKYNKHLHVFSLVVSTKLKADILSFAEHYKMTPREFLENLLATALPNVRQKIKLEKAKEATNVE